MCARGGVFSSTGPYVTYCMVWLHFYEGVRRKSGQLRVSAARGQRAWGHAHPAAPDLETVGFGLCYSTGSSNEKEVTEVLVGVQRKVPFNSVK